MLQNPHNAHNLTEMIVQMFLLCLCTYTAFALSSFVCNLAYRNWFQRIFINSSTNWIHSRTFVHGQLDNVDQRIADDSLTLSFNIMHLLQHLIRSALQLIYFVPALWHISAQTYRFPGLLLWLALAIAIVTSLGFQQIFAKPIARIKYKKSDIHANIRARLKFIQLHSRQVILNQGIAYEESKLVDKLQEYTKQQLRDYKISCIYDIFYGLLTKNNAIFASLLLAPYCLNGTITLGLLTQTTLIFWYVADAFTFWAKHTKDIAATWTAHYRLKELHNSYEPNVNKINKSDNVLIDITELKVNERVLFDRLYINAKAGDRVFVYGRSGIGKTSLIGAIGNINTDYQGQISIPESTWLASQYPYIPLDCTIQEAASYPYTYSKELIDKTLQQVGLNPDAEPHSLSVGQTQRLLFAKLLLLKPKAIFLDEPTSSLPENTSLMLLDMLYTSLPDSIIVTISHQSFVSKLHNIVLDLDTMMSDKRSNA